MCVYTSRHTYVKLYVQIRRTLRVTCEVIHMAGRPRQTSELVEKKAKAAAKKLKAKGYDRKGNKTLSLTIGPLEELEKHAKKEGVSMSYVIDELILAYLAELKG